MDTTNVKLINLGLASGTLWADRNIGADSPEDAGLYFQWGDIEGHNATTTNKPFALDLSDYKHYDSGYNPYTDGKFIKYQGKNEGAVLKLEDTDDAAKANMGAKWSMPTKEQFEELLKETTRKLILSDNTEISHAEGSDFDANRRGRTVKGIKFIGSNGNELFFPASGYLDDGELLLAGAIGYFWSASRLSVSEYHAWHLHFGSDYAGVGTIGRFVGSPVRAIINKTV